MSSKIIYDVSINQTSLPHMIFPLVLFS